MSKHLKQLLIALGLALLASSCGVEEFATKKNKDSLKIEAVSTSTVTQCSQFTYIKPKVDFLFLWDNSSSTNFISPQTMQALNQTIDLISTQFDYHIVLAPLVVPLGSPINQHAALITSDTPLDALTSKASLMKINRSAAATHLATFPSAEGSSEYGTQRAIDILNFNLSNSAPGSKNEAFRQGAHTIVTLMSSEDDDGIHLESGSLQEKLNTFITNKTNQLLSIKNALNSNQLRFFSIVRKTVTCPGYAPMNPFAISEAYTRISRNMFNNVTPTPLDQSKQDSFNLCDVSDFTRIFDGINNSIQPDILGHKYNYWPVAHSGANIDQNEIIVKVDGVDVPYLGTSASSGQHGFTFNNIVQTVNTRYEPTPGEPFTGYVVQFHGDARIVYPECASVRTKTPKEWYGYVHMQSKPVESSIQLKIDGIPVTNCGNNITSCNGYTLMKTSEGQPQYRTNQNMRITGPNDFTPKSPGITRSGYFLILYGNAVYSNNQSIEVIYDPSGT